MNDGTDRPLRRREFLGAIASLPVLPLAWPYGPRAAGLPASIEAAALAREVATSTGRAAASLGALAEAILPSAIGPAGTAGAAAGFQRWLDGYTPGAELDHGYGSGTIRHAGEDDPRSAWRGQLDALDADARAAHGQPFDALDAERRRAVVRAALERAGAQRLGSPISAPHVAAALLAWWYGGPDANDLAQRARIGRETCRPLDAVREQPATLNAGGES